MADFPENKTEEAVEEIETSTIFSDPKQYKDVPKKKKKTWLVVIACLLCVAILFGGYKFVVKNFITLEEKAEQQYKDDSSKIEEQLNASVVKLKEYTADDISQVKIRVGGQTSTLYSESVKEDGETYITWYVKDIKKDATDSDKIAEVVGGVSTLTATKEITEKTEADCGLNKPWMTAAVTPKKGDTYTVVVGNLSPDGSGYYIKFENEKKIYHIKSEESNKSFFEFNVMNMFGGDLMTAIQSNGNNDEYFSNGQVEKFDRLTIKGKNFPEPVVIVNNDNEETAQYLGYIVESPSKRIAQNVEKPLLIFQSDLSVIGAYAFETDAATLKKYGLDKPDIELKIEIGDQTHIYKFTLQDDGNYAAVAEGSMFISKISADELSEISALTTTDFYSTWICYNSINELSNFTIKFSGKTYSFDIAKKESEDDGTEYVITHKGKQLTALNFQYLYQYCVTLKCLDFELEKTTAKPDVIFEFKFETGRKSVIEFIPISATKYQYRVDGIDMGRVSSNAIDKVVKNTEKVSRGETIGQLS